LKEHCVSDVWISDEGVPTERSTSVGEVSLPADAAAPEPIADQGARLTFIGVRAIESEAGGFLSDFSSAVDLELDIDDESGIIVRSGPEVVWSAPWTEMDRCSTPERVNLKSGGRGVLLVASARDRPPLLAVLPVGRPGRAEAAIRARVRRRGVRGRRSAPPAPITLGALAVVAAVVTACLLVAGHSIHL
jgi:hypothetical protein